MENIKTNNHKKILVLSLAIMLVLLMGSAYAFFTYSKVGSRSYNITLRNASLIMNYSKGTRVINLKSAYPLSDTYATDNLDKLSYIDFSISGESKNNENINYEIYLTPNSDNTLSSDYVKVYLADEEGNVIVEPTLFSSLNDTTYEGSNQGKVIYSTSTNQDFTTKYRLYTWIDENYSQNDVSETFGFKVNLYAYNGTTDLVYENLDSNINDSKCSNTKVGSDGTIYLVGDNDCVNYNYVNYSNNLWRVVAINPDKSLKLVSEEPVTVYSGDNVENTETEVNEYLNNDFLNTLNNTENMLTSKSNEATVDLLSVEDYNNIVGSTPSTSYVNNNKSDWLLKSNSVVSADGTIKKEAENLSVCPTITLKSDSKVASGDGTKNSPYQIMS